MKLSAQDPEDCEAGDLVFYEAMTGVSQQKVGGFWRCSKDREMGEMGEMELHSHEIDGFWWFLNKFDVVNLSSWSWLKATRELQAGSGQELEVDGSPSGRFPHVEADFHDLFAIY